MPVFPSVEWFRAVADVATKQEDYTRQGHLDADVGIQVGTRMFEIVFDAFDVTDIKELDATSPRDLDFTLVLPYQTWREMIENIRQNGRADTHHTLNTIDLSGTEEFAQAHDYDRRDKFYRFNQSFQTFFDAAAQVPTEFAPAEAVGASA